MTAVSLKKNQSRSHLRLNEISRGTEFLFAVILGLFALLCIIPFVFVVIISFTGESSISAQGYSFCPLTWSLDAYRQVLRLGDLLWRSYFNSFLITIVGTVLSVTICILYAYPLFRRDYKFRSFFSFLSFFTMIFGGGGDFAIILKMLLHRQRGKEAVYYDHPYECGVVVFEKD